MAEEQTVIYTAHTSQEAYMLRNALSEVGIRAVVLNEVLARGSGALTGWATLARVAVAERDAARARQIALEFEGQRASTSVDSTGEERTEEGRPAASDTWPTCPECGAMRSTRCPICQTAGTDFSPADADYTGIPGLDDAARSSAAYGCGPEGCAPRDAVARVALDVGQDERQQTPLMLLCPTCDEPFAPEYPRICEWCGQEFEDGFEVETPQDEAEHNDTRVILVMTGLLLLVVAVIVYFMIVM